MTSLSNFEYVLQKADVAAYRVSEIFDPPVTSSIEVLAAIKASNQCLVSKHSSSSIAFINKIKN